MAGAAGPSSRRDASPGAEYTGQLTPLAVRRLTKERDLLGREDLAEQGIHYHFDSSLNHRAVALIVGPKDTPYDGGFYLFEFTFPNSYPLKPPHVAFLTGDGRVRFNPNLYVNGKVCLSILGTWQGPSWTSALTFRTTLFSIQSLLCSRPLQNEPGHESSNGRDCELYSTMLRYENVAVAVLQLAQPLPECLHPLRATMARLFMRCHGEYLRALEAFDGREGTCDKCPLYGFVTRYSPSSVRRSLEELRQRLLEDSELHEELASDLSAISSGASPQGAPGGGAAAGAAAPPAGAGSSLPAAEQGAADEGAPDGGAAAGAAASPAGAESSASVAEEVVADEASRCAGDKTAEPGLSKPASGAGGEPPRKRMRGKSSN